MFARTSILHEVINQRRQNYKNDKADQTILQFVPSYIQFSTLSRAHGGLFTSFMARYLAQTCIKVEV